MRGYLLEYQKQYIISNKMQIKKGKIRNRIEQERSLALLVSNMFFLFSSSCSFPSPHLFFCPLGNRHLKHCSIDWWSNLECLISSVNNVIFIFNKSTESYIPPACFIIFLLSIALGKRGSERPKRVYECRWKHFRWFRLFFTIHVWLQRTA